MRYLIILQSLLSASFCSTAWEPQMQPPTDRRAAAQELMQQNNFREAAEIFSTLLRSPDAAVRQPDDLSNAVNCLIRLGEIAEAEQLLEAAATDSQDRSEFLVTAAKALKQLPHDGFLIAGEFHRGPHRGGGSYVSVAERDRVRVLQLLLQAVSAADARAEQMADVWMMIAEDVGMFRFSEAWKLQTLTDFSTLPEPRLQERFGRFPGQFGSNQGAPVDKDGNPVLHLLPESWEAAVTDGERWRWALHKVAQIDPSRRSETELLHARFLRSQFGTGRSGLQNPEPVRSQADAADSPDAATAKSLPLPQMLDDSQTLANLATGVRLIALPEEFNFITLLKTIVNRHDGSEISALEELISEYMQRHQYPRAVDQLRQLRSAMTADPAAHQTSVDLRIQQITGNWLQFEPTETQPAGSPVNFDLRYRNGSNVRFRASRVRLQPLLQDIRNYFDSNPEQPDWNRMQLQGLGWHLIHDNEKRYTESDVTEWSHELSPPADHFDAIETITAPLPQAGAWWVTADLEDGNRAAMVLWVADLALAIRRVEAGTMYFVADAASGKPVADCELDLFGWRSKATRNPRDRFETIRLKSRVDGNGLATQASDQDQTRYQWLTVATAPDGRMAFDGFHQIWTTATLQPLVLNQNRVFAITDRPIYRPGHKLQYRLWLRNPRFDSTEDSSPGTQVALEIRNPKGDAVEKTSGKLDQWGGIDGEWTLPQDAMTGNWTITLSIEQEVPGIPVIDGRRIRIMQTREQVVGSGRFVVEEYRKPEYEVQIEAPETPIALGETFTATVNARYFFGAPVTNAKVHYTVERTSSEQRWFPAARWDWLYEPGYWWFAESSDWHPGYAQWACLPPIRPWWNWSPDPPETVAEGEAEIGPDGSLTIPIDTAAAQDLQGNTDHRYSIRAEVTDRSRRTIIGTGSVMAARSPFRVFTWLNRGHYRTGATARFSFQARTADGRPVQATGKAVLSQLNSTDNELNEQTLESWDITTDESGAGSIRVELPAAGQFRLQAELTSSAGSTEQGATIFLVRGANEDTLTYRFNALELTPDLQEYAPGDTLRLQVSTDQTDSTVLLFVRPANGVCPAPRILQLTGKSTVVSIPVSAADYPNFFVEALTIADGQVHSQIREIIVPPQERVTDVDVVPAADRGRPGDEANVAIRLTDINGNPVSGNVVVSVYDASLEAIAADSIPEIRSFFWKVRRNHSIQLQSSLNRIEQSLTKDGEPRMKPLSTGAAFGAPGGMNMWYFGASPRMMMRGGAPEMMMDGAMPMEAAAAAGAPMMKAGGIGGGAEPTAEPVLRSEFADTAFWTATAVADASGKLEISFPLPDNLTTWKIQVWSLADGTRVGSGTSEIIAAKDLLIRPQTPRFLTTRDQIVFSAVVHNYLQSEKNVRVQLQADGNLLSTMTPLQQTVRIPAGGEARVDWLMQAESAGDAEVRMVALTDEESDAVLLTVPVHVHGLLKTDSFTGVIRPQDQSSVTTLVVPAERIPELSRLEVRFSPSLAGAMVDALPWLVDYPHGCTEQTLNRFLPAVLVRRTLQDTGLDLEQVRQNLLQLNAQRTYRGKYPKHWGDPPAVQTRDLRELPAGFGKGSSTLAAWIREKIEQDLNTAYGLNPEFNPVFSAAELDRIVSQGVSKLVEMQLSDGGWGWFSGYGEHSSAHLTALIVRGLSLARQNGVAVPDDAIARGVQWLQAWQQQELGKLRRGDLRRENPDAPLGSERWKMAADNNDALIALVLTEADACDQAIDDYLYRDRGSLTAYGMALTGLLFDLRGDMERCTMLIRNLRQFVVRDAANQTAWLQLPAASRWYWYGSENEAMAAFLQLLIRRNPQDEDAPQLVKYLLNNRGSDSRWDSTRDTALVVESLTKYVRATGEDAPDMNVEVLIDGQVVKTVQITAENLFSFDNTFLLEGTDLASGSHQLEVRRTGTGPVYFSGWLTGFSLEDQITAAGLEVQVSRRYYRLEAEQQKVNVSGSRGQVVQQQTGRYRRIPLKASEQVASGTLVEVELILDSRNDYEFLLLEDHKPAGFEPDDQRSGYVFEGLTAYRELRDDRVCFFLSSLARGQHSISYRMRAEAPGNVSALPATIEGVYAPELVGNSDEMKLQVVEQN